MWPVRGKVIVGDRPAGNYVATLTWPDGSDGSDRLSGAVAEPDGSGLLAIVKEGPNELAAFEVRTTGAR